MRLQSVCGCFVAEGNSVVVSLGRFFYFLAHFALSKYEKAETDPVQYRHLFSELCEQFDESVFIYTGGSKDGDKVACAVATPSFVTSKRLPDKMSIFSAELEALASALRFIIVSRSDKFVIFSDSKSCLQAIRNKWEHPIVQKILNIIQTIYLSPKTVNFCWNSRQ